jgi:hypothetical protein
MKQIKQLRGRDYYLPDYGANETWNLLTTEQKAGDLSDCVDWSGVTPETKRALIYRELTDERVLSKGWAKNHPHRHAEMLQEYAQNPPFEQVLPDGTIMPQTRQMASDPAHRAQFQTKDKDRGIDR